MIYSIISLLGLSLLVFLILPAGVAAWQLVYIKRKRRKKKYPSDYGFGYECLEVTSFDKLQLRAWLIFPHSPNYRTIILLHGMHLNGAFFLYHAIEFCKLGYTVLLPDHRAHGESDGKYCTFGKKEKEDLKCWVDELTHREMQQIGVLGISLGGIIGLQAAAEDDRIKALAVQSPYTALSDIIVWSIQKQPFFAWQIWLPKIVFFILRKVADVDPIEINLLAAASKLKVPLAVIAGALDKAVPVAMCKHVYETAFTAQLYLEVSDASHNNIHKKAGDKYWKSLDTFFRLM